MYQLEIRDLAATSEFAGKFASWIVPHLQSNGICVALLGELGSGKTTFVSAFLKNLDSNEPVSSPTYILEHNYTSPRGINVSHWDLYRLPEGSTPDELFEPVSTKEIRMIEWAERSAAVLKSADLEISFEILDEACRRVNVRLMKEGISKKLNLADLESLSF